MKERYVTHIYPRPVAPGMSIQLAFIAASNSSGEAPHYIGLEDLEIDERLLAELIDKKFVLPVKTIAVIDSDKAVWLSDEGDVFVAAEYNQETQENPLHDPNRVSIAAFAVPKEPG